MLSSPRYYLSPSLDDINLLTRQVQAAKFIEWLAESEDDESEEDDNSGDEEEESTEASAEEDDE